MSTDIVPFAYGGQTVRVVTIDGEPWFVLADLCKVLDIRNVKDVRDRLDDGVDQTYPITDLLGRTQQATIVSEPGMYEVVIRSDKPEAAAFRRWITGEVLPSIRKTGGYGVPAVRELTPDEIVARAFEITRARVAELETRVAEQDETIEVLTPAANRYADFMDAEGAYTFDAAAKIIGTGRVRLMAQLRRDGVLTRDNLPTQRHKDTGRFLVKIGKPWEKPDGTKHVSRSTRVTAKGLDWLIAKYTEDPDQFRLILGGAS